MFVWGGGGEVLFLNRNVRNASIFVNVRLSEITKNFDIQQSKTPNELNKSIDFFLLNESNSVYRSAAV